MLKHSENEIGWEWAKWFCAKYTRIHTIGSKLMFSEWTQWPFSFRQNVYAAFSSFSSWSFYFYLPLHVFCSFCAREREIETDNNNFFCALFPYHHYVFTLHRNSKWPQNASSETITKTFSVSFISPNRKWLPKSDGNEIATNILFFSSPSYCVKMFGALLENISKMKPFILMTNIKHSILSAQIKYISFAQQKHIYK